MGQCDGVFCFFLYRFFILLTRVRRSVEIRLRTSFVKKIDCIRDDILGDVSVVVLGSFRIGEAAPQLLKLRSFFLHWSCTMYGFFLGSNVHLKRSEFSNLCS